LVPLLAEDFRLVSLDLPAFGLTGAVPSGEYTIENFKETVSELTHYLDIEKFSIAGNSMGGHVAWRYALEYPDQIEGLILIAAGGVSGEEQTMDDSPIVWKLMDSSLARKILLFFTPKFFAEQGLQTAVADPKLVTEELVSQFHELALLKGSREAILSMITGDRRSSSGPEIFNQISAPTLVIHGEEDNLIQVESSKYFEENIPNVEVKIYSNIGHLPMYEDPERTAKDIRNFINGISSQ
jgi:pimeloyl-ACP methyl ester carboxylesterase